MGLEVDVESGADNEVLRGGQQATLGVGSPSVEHTSR